MKKNRTVKSLFVILSLISMTKLGFSQAQEINITFIGNAALHVSDGETNLYVDFPYKSGAFGYMEYEETQLDSIKKNSIFLFTHRHADHYSRKLLKTAKKKYNGRVYGNWNAKKLAKFNESMNGLSIQSFKTKHKFTMKHYSYLISWHGKTLFIAGDTPVSEIFGKLDKLDWAFMPYWLYRNAKSRAINIDAKSIGIYHLSDNQKIEKELSDRIHLLRKRNERMSIPY